MNSDFILNEWVPALRGGGYKQGQEALKSRYDEEDHFCCLGVACDLLIKKGILPGWVVKNDYDFSVNGEAEYLPKEAADFIGILKAGPSVDIYPDDEFGDDADLAELNDEHEWSFDQIAGVLERLVREGGDE